MSNRIVMNGAVWDLHIHTCLCPKGSGEFSAIDKSLSTANRITKYLDMIVPIFKCHPELEMISFSDHNQISSEVYSAFNQRKTGIIAIPGIELDTCLMESGKIIVEYKHLLFYFDDQKFVFGKHDVLINKYIKDQLKTSPSVDISLFLNFLITQVKVPFVIDPHFMKQGQRGIDYDWNDPEKAKNNIGLFTDQFFCFWESGGDSEIAKGEAFLLEFNQGQKISIIHFSDSNNTQTLKNYLESPPQYFNALPSFEGLRMAGSEIRRITKSRTVYPEKDFGRFIGSIRFKDGKEIKLSPRLNTIIGGRGSGKSLLLDSIYFETKDEKDEKTLRNDREKFIKEISFHAFSLSGKNISPSFNVDYYGQNWVYAAFDSPEELAEFNYFKSEFSEIKDFDLGSKRTSLIDKYSFCQIKQTEEKANLTSIQSRIKILKGTTDKITLKSGRKRDLLEYSIFNVFLDKIYKPSIIPAEIQNDEEIQRSIKALFAAVCNSEHVYNAAVISDNLSYNIAKNYMAAIEKKNAELKEKNAALELLKTKLDELETPYVNRVSAINSIISLSEKCNCSERHSTSRPGFEGHKFIFCKDLSIENPLRYLHRILVASLDDSKVRSIKKGTDKKDFNNIPVLIDCYCFHLHETIMESVDEKELDDEVFTLSKLEIKQTPKILYERDGAPGEDLMKVSPGTRANYVMEFIVNKDTSVPLLIDQPEDNIDSNTIAGELTKWFSALKSKRQIIVATHDPNIVVNADSENIIVCDKKGEMQFSYSYGALETKESLDSVKKILEGGAEALERRIDKYGKI
jgi:predicted ATPase